MTTRDDAERMWADVDWYDAAVSDRASLAAELRDRAPDFAHVADQIDALPLGDPRFRAAMPGFGSGSDLCLDCLLTSSPA